MMRLVLDTNVVVSGLLWNGLPRQLLEATWTERAVLFTSAPLIDELTNTLLRAKFDRKITASLLSVDQLIHLYMQQAILVVPLPTPRLVLDPDDDVVIGTALAAKADFLVTGDHALLSVSSYEGGRIVSIQEALEHLQAPKGQGEY